jgi:hypothetical protein
MVTIVGRWCAVMAVSMALSGSMLAQRMVVNVRDAVLRTGVAGALVTAVERETGAQAFGLTNDAGQASVRLPAAGEWAVSVRRIGLVPARAAAVRVDSAQSVTISLVVSSVRFTLPAVRVSAVATCGRAPRGDDRAATLWEQVSLALRSSMLTREDSMSTPARPVRMFERFLDLARRPYREQPLRAGVSSGRPFFAASPDSLARFGYVRRESDGNYVYFAPDDVVLLSEAFLRTHCFESPAYDADPRLAELRFRPVPGRDQPDVAGTAFVDTTTGELRRIEYRYVNTDALFAQLKPDAGGDVSLRELPSGRWMVSAWTIRMPRFVTAGWRRGNTLSGYREVSGVVEMTGAADSSTRGVVADGATPARTTSDSVANWLVRRQVSQDTVPTPMIEYQFGRVPGWRWSGVRIALPKKQSARESAADSLRDVRRAAGLTLREGVTARAIALSSKFDLRRVHGVGEFFDSTALATPRVDFATDLVFRISGITNFRVPDSVPKPSAFEDVDLAAQWMAGTDLPMMPTPDMTSTEAPLCLVKLVLDGTRVLATELRALPADEIAALEFYRYPRDVPGAFRRSGNRCGTALFWSYAFGRGREGG